MTTEEVIKWLSEISCIDCKDKDDDNSCIEATGKCFEAKRTAIEALYKQLPKKLTKGIFYPHCPVCNAEVMVLLGTDGQIEYRMNYCPKCGQAIDWSKE